MATHPAYAAPDTPTRVLAAAIANPDFRKAWSDPDKMARAISEVVSRGKAIPIRFPLGAMAFGLLREEFDTMSREFDEIKPISIGVDDAAQGAAHLAEVKQFARV